MKVFFVTVLLSIGLAFVPSLHARDSINSYININGFANIGVPLGTLMDAEHDSTLMVVQYDNGVIKMGRPDFYSYGFGTYIDVMPFAPFLTEKNNAGFKVGIRARYSWVDVHEKVVVGGGLYEEKGDNVQFLYYHSIMVGPVLYIAPIMIEEGLDYGFFSNFIILVYSNFGSAFNGKINPNAVYHHSSDIKATIDYLSYRFGVEGFRWETGIGFELSGGLPIHLGFNIFYAHTWLEVHKSVYNYPSYTRKSNYSEFKFEIYTGFSI